MKDKKAHVEVFGHSVDTDECCDDEHDHNHWRHWHHWDHHHHHEAPVLGVMFLLAGIVLFLNVIGQVPWTIWHMIWKFWPVILIFIGIQILSGLILFLLALFIFGIIIIYSLQVVGSPLVAHLVLPWWIANVLVELRRIML